MFLCDNQWKFQTFSILQLWNKFSGKRKPFFKKLEYRFLVETTKIENGLFPFKTALPEANVKGTATDMRYFARSKLSKSLVHKKNFSLMQQVVFKLGYVFCQER